MKEWEYSPGIGYVLGAEGVETLGELRVDRNIEVDVVAVLVFGLPVDQPSAAPVLRAEPS